MKELEDLKEERKKGEVKDEIWEKEKEKREEDDNEPKEIRGGKDPDEENTGEEEEKIQEDTA